MATGVRKALSRLMRILRGKKKCYCYHDMIMITGTENRNDHELLLMEGYYFSHMSESRKDR